MLKRFLPILIQSPSSAQLHTLPTVPHFNKGLELKAYALHIDTCFQREIEIKSFKEFPFHFYPKPKQCTTTHNTYLPLLDSIHTSYAKVTPGLGSHIHTFNLPSFTTDICNENIDLNIRYNITGNVKSLLHFSIIFFSIVVCFSGFTLKMIVCFWSI